jgi:hypothetical protein
MRTNGNITLKVVAIASVITLLVFASGITTITKPTDAANNDYGKAGYVYSVEYQCGTRTTASDGNFVARPGTYSTNILIHNPFTNQTRVHFKILPELGAGAGTGVWLSTVNTGNLITRDETLVINCDDLRNGTTLSSAFAKGVLVISHEVEEPFGSGGSKEGVLISQPLFGDESLDVTAAYTYLAAGGQQTHINKVLVKKKVLTNSTGLVTSTIHELLIPAATGTISVTTPFDIKAAIDTQLGCTPTTPGVSPICEVISIDYGVDSGGGGASKHVETIKGKFVPFIPKNVSG